MSLEDYDDGDKIDDLWRKARYNFEFLTQRDLKRLPPLSLEDAIEKLETKYRLGEADKNDRTKKNVQNVLKCMQQFIGIAGDAASTVYGPASVCANAASFLFDIPAKIDKFYASVADIFKEMDSYLSVLKVYKQMETIFKIDDELMKSTHRILISFVDVSARAYGFAVEKKRHRIKTTTKLIFCDDDSGVKDSLDNFRDLVQRQFRLESAVNLKITTEVKQDTGKISEDVIQVKEETGHIFTDVVNMRTAMDTGLGILVSDRDDRTAEKSSLENYNRISERLMVDNEVFIEQSHVLQRMKLDVLPQTTKQLQGDARFKKWADPESEVHPLLVLTGKSMSGKSFLASAIVDELEAKNNIREASKSKFRLLTAYHFFRKKDERGGKDRKQDKRHAKRSLETALKHMCLQMVKQHTGFAKEMAAYCNGKKSGDFRDRSCEELWNELKLGSPRGEVIHVLFFDGLDNIADEVVQQLLVLLSNLPYSSVGQTTARPMETKLRIVVTGDLTKAQLEYFPQIPVLDITEHNADNIRNYINRQLEFDDLLKNQTSEASLMIDTVPDLLLVKAKGSFLTLAEDLRRVKDAMEDDDVDRAREVLNENPEEDEDKAAEEILSNLASSLTAKDIERLNWLMLWLVHGGIAFSIDELHAIASLHSKTNKTTFVSMLKSKYSRVIKIGDDKRVVLNESVLYYLRRNQAKREGTSGDVVSTDPRITLEIKINNVPISSARKFFWSLTEPNALEQFTLASAKMEDVDSRKPIRTNFTNALLAMTEHCFALLSEPPEESTTALVPYAMRSAIAQLFDFFVKDMDDKLMPEDRKLIQKSLFSFLTDTRGLAEHQISGLDMRNFWLKKKTDVDVVRDWLTDEQASQCLDRVDKRHLDQFMRLYPKGAEIWTPVTLTMGKLWLLTRREMSVQAYFWVDGYLDALESDFPESDDGNESPDPDLSGSETSSLSGTASRSITVQTRVLRAANWVKQNVPDSEEDSLWHEQLGKTYLLLRLHELSSDSFREALNLPGSHWTASCGLASALDAMDLLEEACLELETAISKASPIDDLTPYELSVYKEHVFELISMQESAKTLDKAIATCEKAIETMPLEYPFYLPLLRLLYKSGEHEQVQTLVEKWHQTRDPDHELSKLGEILSVLAVGFFRGNRGYHTTLEPLVQMVLAADISHQVCNGLRETGAHLEKTNPVAYSVLCRLMEAYLVQFKNMDKHGYEEALDICKQLYANKKLWQTTNLYNSDALGFVCELSAACHFQLGFAALKEGGSSSQQVASGHVEGLRELLLRAPKTDGFFKYNALSNIGGLLLKLDRRDEARELYMGYLKETLDLLSDDDEENDVEGYFQLALLFCYWQDDVNALIVWSLIAPYDDGYDLDSESDTKIVPTHLPTIPETPELEEVVLTESDGTLPDFKVVDPVKEETKSPTAHEITEPSDVDSEEPIEMPELDQDRPVYIKMHRKYVSRFALDKWMLPWFWESEAKDFVIVTRYISDDVQGDLFDYTKRQKALAYFNFTCAGACGKEWQKADDQYVCKYCLQTIFCQECLEKLKNGRMYRGVCKPDHDWLHVPPWSWEEYRKIGKGKVWNGGKIEDGRVKGEKKINVEEWLDQIRKDWGVYVPPKTTKRDRYVVVSRR